MLTQTESNEGSSELDNLISELEKETLPEDSSDSKTEKIKDKQAQDTVKQIKDEPDWKDKKNDEFNTYDYSDDKELSDDDW